MNKLHLFTLLLILSDYVVNINSTGINHANQRSPASIIYADGPAPDELKAGPTNKNSSDHRKQNTKAVLQRYIVTTGAPTFETIYESSAMTPNLRSSANDDFIAEKLNSDDFSIHHNGHMLHDKQNHAKGKIRFTNSHFERITDDESNKFQAYDDSTTISPEYQAGVSSSDDSSSTNIDSTQPSVNHPTSSVYPVYRDPMSKPETHSTSFTNEHSTYHDKDDFDNDDLSKEINQQNESDNSNSHSPYNEKNNSDNGSHAHNSEYIQHTTPSISPGYSISTSIIEPKIPTTPSIDFKQTHHIINHQPISNNQTNSNPMLERFTYGDHINHHQNVHIVSPPAVPVLNHHSTVYPVYHPQSAIHHIPVVTEIPVTEEREHHGVIEKTINVPQHGIQTKTYEIRRPAIQKQFYDIEEHVSVKPAGSVVIEIDQPISKTPTGHVSTIPVNVKTDSSYGTYLPPASPHPLPHGGQEHSVPHEHSNNNAYLPPAPSKPVSHNDGGGQANFDHGHNNHGFYINPQPVAHNGDEHEKHSHHSQNGGYGGYAPSITLQPVEHNIGEHQKELGHSHNTGYENYVPQIALQPVPQNAGGHDKHLDHSHHNGYGSYITPLQTISHGGSVHGSPYGYVHNNHYFQPHSRIVYGNAPDCNNQQLLYNLHQVNNVPHYSIPIGSAVTTTQTSGHLEDASNVVNVNHSEKYVDSLKQHTPNHTTSSKTLETLSRLQEVKPNPPQHENHSPQMLAKGEPDFSLPPYVEIKSHGQPFSVNTNTDKNFAANNLYAMHSIINNNLYNVQNKETSENLPTSQINSQNPHSFTSNINAHNEKVIQQPVHVAHVQEINKSQFQNVRQGPKSDTGLESVESLIISPKTQPNVDSAKFQPKTGFTTITEPSALISTTGQEIKSASSSELPTSNAYSQKPYFQNPQYLSQPSHIEVFNSETYKEEHKYHHINPIPQKLFYSQVPGVTYQQTGIDQKAHSQKLQNPIQPFEEVTASKNIVNPSSQKTYSSNQSGVTYQGEPAHNNNYPHFSQDYNKQDRQDRTHPSPNIGYSQVPAITYQIRNDQFANIRSQNQHGTPHSSRIQTPNSERITAEENLHRNANYQIQNPNYPQVSISGNSAKLSNEKSDPTIVSSGGNPSAQFLTGDINLSTSTAFPNAQSSNSYAEQIQSQPGHIQASNAKITEKGNNNNQFRTMQSGAYLQSPASSYQIRTDQLPYHSALTQAPQNANLENGYNGHLTAGYQNTQLPLNFQIQPCQSDNALHQPVRQHAPTAHSTEINNDHADIKYPQVSSKYQQVHPPQYFHNSGKESSTPFTSQSEPNSQGQLHSLPEHKQNVMLQNYQLPPQANNEPYKNYQQQSFPQSDPQYNNYPNENKKENAPQKSDIQYFPPHNKLRAEGINFENQQPSNAVIFNQYENGSNNNTNNGAIHDNGFVTVQRTHHGDNSGSEYRKPEQYQSPSPQIAADSYRDNKPINSTEIRRSKKPKSDRYRTHSAIQDSVTTPNHSHLRIANNIPSNDPSISFHPLPSQSQSHILEYLLTNKGHSAQPVIPPHDPSSHHNYGFDSVKTRVVSATPASKFAKAAGEKVNTRRIVVNQPVETVQVVEEQVPITTYKQVTVQQPTVYKTQTQVGVKKVETTVPVMISPIYPGVPVYHGSHENSHVYLNHNHHIAPTFHDNYHIVNAQVGLHAPPGSEYSHAPVTVH